MIRRMITTRRLVPLDRLDEYLERWTRLRESVTAAEGHAWLFRTAGREDQHIEFLESTDLDRVLGSDDVAAARETLDELFGEGLEEEWEEAPTP